MSVQAINNALQFLLILRIDVLPQHVLCGVAIEIPIAFGGMRIHRANGVKSIFDLGRQQVTVLISDLGRRAFEMNVHPMIAFETIGRLQARFVRFRWVLLCEPESGEAEYYTNGEQWPNNPARSRSHRFSNVTYDRSSLYLYHPNINGMVFHA